MDEYSMGKEIGRGSYASVYLVQEKKTGDKFVMKKIILKDLSPKDVAACMSKA
jgi:serine/threonine protein kinase